jgi:hypothetical protein
MATPTAEQIQAAEEYATSKLCTEIPGKFMPGLTRWEGGQCRITEFGCDANNESSPISRLGFTSNGDYISPLVMANDPMFREFWKKWEPEHYVMKVTKKSPYKKVCARANHLFYRWCMYPAARSDQWGTEKKGYTDVPRFEYAVRNGVETCIIGKDYCDNRGISYNGTPGKEECYVSTAQKVGEFFASDVLVRRINASDKRLKKNIKVHKYDAIAPGIHMYLYEWNDLAKRIYGLEGADMGFIADDLEKVNPNFVFVDNRGYKIINVDLEEDSPIMFKIRMFLYIKDTFIKDIIDVL